MNGFSLICFIGASIRLLFYRIVGRKDITMKYLTSKKNDQQITSIGFGFLAILLLIFAIKQIL